MAKNLEKMRESISNMMGAKPTKEETIQTLTDTIEDKELREALQERRNLHRGRPCKNSNPYRIGDSDIRKTIVINEDLYKTIVTISLHETLTIKEVIDSFLRRSLEEYEAKKGKVTPSETLQGDSSNLFK